MLQRRRRTSISFPRTSSIPELEWLSKTLKDINFGLQEDFTLPSRIEVSIPMSMPILGTQALNIRLIDTRGIDEPSATRQDLQAYLDDDRAILVLCSKFDDAPSPAIQSLIERATQIDLRDKLLERGLLLLLPRGGEEARMVDMTGEPVADTEEGRSIRRDQVQTTTLIDLDMRGLPIEFLDVENTSDDDCGQKRVSSKKCCAPGVLGPCPRASFRGKSRSTLRCADLLRPSGTKRGFLLPRVECKSI